MSFPNLKITAKKVLKNFYYKQPVFIKSITCFVLNKILRRFRYLFLTAYLYRGKEKTTGKPVSFLFIGRDIRIAAYWIHRIYCEPDNMQRLKKMAVWNTPAYIRKNRGNADLAMVEMNGFTRRFIRTNAGFIIPRWIEVELLPEKVLKTEAIKDITRRIRKYDLSFRILPHSETDFQFFFDRMYIPNITKRHGDSAIHSDYRYFLNIYKQKGSQLGYIFKDDIPVAGTFTEFMNNDFVMFAMGILDGRQDILKMGVAGALYYYITLYCIEKGIEKINIGGTSPILTDGLTQHKISLGAEMAGTEYLGDLALWLLPLKNTPGVRNILTHNPFVFKTGKEFNIAVFIEQDKCKTEEELLRILHHVHIENIHATRIYCFDGAETIKGVVADKGLGNIDVVAYQF